MIYYKKEAYMKCKTTVPFQVFDNSSPKERDEFINSFEEVKVDDFREVFILTKGGAI